MPRVKIKSGFFERRGIFYRFGHVNRNLPTLVFIHGLAGSSSAWLPYEKRFGGTYNTLSIDLRGHGRSFKPKRYRDYNFMEFVHDLNELLKHLDIKKFILVSHSFGTVIALEYLLEYPGRALSSVFICLNYGIHKMLRARLTWPILLPLTRIVDRMPVRRNYGIEIDYAKYPRIWDWDFVRFLFDIANTSLRVSLYCLEHLYKFNKDGLWARVRTPSLILHGSKDTLIPLAKVVTATNEMPNAKLIPLERANHLLIVDNFEEVAALIEGFILDEAS